MPPMDVTAPTPLLGGLSPKQFMRRHWQKAPLLVRQAWPEVQPPLGRAELFALAGREGVESRLVQHGPRAWRLRKGPFSKRALPPVSRPGWTLLVQGLDLHVPAARAMLDRFRFVPDARLDDLMVSWASDGGGVGPHLDAYDVFLLQVQGRRRWRHARVHNAADAAFVEGQPLKLLRRFEPTCEAVLGPGDMLYLPPGWAHEGTAVGGDCITCSIGFRAPASHEVAHELLSRLADSVPADTAAALRRYADAKQAATGNPAEVPQDLARFATRAVLSAILQARVLPRVLGEWLSEPKPDVWFDASSAMRSGRSAVVLDARSRMLYDKHHVFINGEAFVAGGRDARLMRLLADQRALGSRDRARLSEGAAALLDEWLAAGWLHEVAEFDPRAT